MKRLARWIGLAAFCAAFGFLGSLAAVQVMADSLRGEPGQPGATGDRGPMGPTGPPPDLQTVGGAIQELDQRLTAVEDRGLTTFCSWDDETIQVVTEVADGRAYTGSICLGTHWQW